MSLLLVLEVMLGEEGAGEVLVELVDEEVGLVDEEVGVGVMRGRGIEVVGKEEEEEEECNLSDVLLLEVKEVTKEEEEVMKGVRLRAVVVVDVVEGVEEEVVVFTLIPPHPLSIEPRHSTDTTRKTRP